MTQQSLFRPGSGNREVATVQERILSRTDDPETSREAARKVSARLPECQQFALYVIDVFGPGTLRAIAEEYVRTAMDAEWLDATKLYHELSRRAPELAREGLIDYQRDADGRALKVDGARVWSISR